ncbi:hypothetical protein [Streptomyces prunicolor]|uniref:hypothetical protein n=1 Tax=Streptomyces prunicolor TaxID=67348 RepID=UPI0034295FF4
MVRGRGRPPWTGTTPSKRGFSHQEPNGPSIRFTSPQPRGRGQEAERRRVVDDAVRPPGPAQPRVRLPVRRRFRGRAEHRLPATEQQLDPRSGLVQQCRAPLCRLADAHQDHDRAPDQDTVKADLRTMALRALRALRALHPEAT